jgi:hypothetical protein
MKTNASTIIKFISYVWWLLHVSALYCHTQGAFLEPSERCAQLRCSRILWMGTVVDHTHTHTHTHKAMYHVSAPNGEYQIT